jgi:hypothetical protein
MRALGAPILRDTVGVSHPITALGDMSPRDWGAPPHIARVFERRVIPADHGSMPRLTARAIRLRTATSQAGK